MNDTDRQRCLALAAALQALRAVAALGLMLTLVGLLLVALLALLAGATAVPLAAAWVLILGQLERLWATRIAFDARLFSALADGGLPDLGALDAALAALGLRPNNASPQRDLSARLAGTRRLVQQHLAIVIIQALGCGLALCLMPWRAVWCVT